MCVFFPLRELPERYDASSTLVFNLITVTRVVFMAENIDSGGHFAFFYFFAPSLYKTTPCNILISVISYPFFG